MSKAEDPRPVALWGGVECTVNRVGDQWFDQTRRSGHQERPEDLNQFAALGLTALRYPALWERISPDRPDEHDFSWTDQRLPRIQALGMNPIVTLCHHGSGPAYTNLLDEGFAGGLARHAAAVAERYPWLRDWTPVNEPLTTARFSALYGFWHPHTRDEVAFWIALLNEIDATRLSMRAIRRINPQARLVQTDDLGFYHATPSLRAAADFQNDRRWMGWDLLCGRVVPGHALWDRLVGFGLESRLRTIAEDPCPPDVIGVNYYLSSERLLDDRLHLHGCRSLADRSLGDLDGVPFVDVDAVRNHEGGILGLETLLRQAWDRYGIPLAVTECHNGATRDDQVRWFVDVWRSAERLARSGVDVRAVTAWSLLGSYDWNRMVTRSAGHYEPGVFDVRSGTLRRTLMADVLTDLAAGRQPSSPALDVAGWWKRSDPGDSLTPAGRDEFKMARSGARSGRPRPLMIVGRDGGVADMAALACEVRGLAYCTSEVGTKADLIALDPWGVLDCRRSDEPAARWRQPCPATADTSSLIGHCQARDVRYACLIGLLDRDDHGAGEVLTFRTAPIFGPDQNDSVAATLLNALDKGSRVHPRSGGHWRDVYGPSAIDTALDLMLDREKGVFDLVAQESWSEVDLAKALCVVAEADPALIQPMPPGDKSPDEARPACHGSPSPLPPGETMIERFVRERRLGRQGVVRLERRPDDVRLQAAG